MKGAWQHTARCFIANHAGPFVLPHAHYFLFYSACSVLWPALFSDFYFSVVLANYREPLQRAEDACFPWLDVSVPPRCQAGKPDLRRSGFPA